uniref:Transmembrane protein 267 n=1 Tax=Albugo laibachii Nc14 TaxID=890382 RepID=F0WCU7_9STRA|nr:conserved hypothetical protein [Albugo laibachii Nc14]|eukprot:CCA19016.1 conserved hypothetical protein [Albugo laibachii Nc14]
MRVILYGVLVFSCVSVDLLLGFLKREAVSRVILHLVDNAGHGLIAFVSYAAFALWKAQANRKRACIRSMMAGICSCALDFDHFIAAKSFHLNAATNLKTRPFAHSFCFIALICMIVWKKTSKHRFHRVALVFIALSSHQLRDALRHGMWFWPFGSTPPIPYALYLFIQVLLPLSIAKAQASRHASNPTVGKVINV